ncbi:bifunctional diaminohydroxyphosphoribosylaminopyrimidine deaminase/5-amino-6-(5-phosphoribosylamino)uracil reductase RibD [Salinispirillum marinum]|uniref:Riboflavin biosynthesis protein RibD n=2 Tax=Saccharospirillaceae TaxID=255527 RepID=A0ABV8BK01_9GAMM
MMSAVDAHWMQKALRLAERGLFATTPNPRVGAVVVQGDVEVGAGWHPGAGQPHAEVFALRAAGSAAKGATVYVTLEPCSHLGRTPPCADALVAAQVARVVVASHDPNPLVSGQGLARLRAAGIDVTEGVLTAAADAVNIGFLQRMRTGRPWVRAKIAHSLDGRTAMASGESFWITGEAARADVQYWRARSCAVLTGADTLLQDQSRLQVRMDLLAQRWPGHPQVKPPLRCVIDSQLRVPPEHPFFAESSAVLCTLASQPERDLEPYRARGVTVLQAPALAGKVDITFVLQQLAAQQGVNEVLLEAGPTLIGACFRHKLIDEFIFYQAPRLLGSTGRPLMDLPLSRMDEAINLRVTDQRQFGADWRIMARVEGTSTDEVNARTR